MLGSELGSELGSGLAQGRGVPSSLRKAVSGLGPGPGLGMGLDSLGQAISKNVVLQHTEDPRIGTLLEASG